MFCSLAFMSAPTYQFHSPACTDSIRVWSVGDQDFYDTNEINITATSGE